MGLGSVGLVQGPHHGGVLDHRGVIPVSSILKVPVAAGILDVVSSPNMDVYLGRGGLGIAGGQPGPVHDGMAERNIERVMAQMRRPLQAFTRK